MDAPFAKPFTASSSKQLLATYLNLTVLPEIVRSFIWLTPPRTGASLYEESNRRLMEVAGVEPASKKALKLISTCVVDFSVLLERQNQQKSKRASP